MEEQEARVINGAPNAVIYYSSCLFLKSKKRKTMNQWTIRDATRLEFIRKIKHKKLTKPTHWRKDRIKEQKKNGTNRASHSLDEHVFKFCNVQCTHNATEVENGRLYYHRNSKTNRKFIANFLCAANFLSKL